VLSLSKIPEMKLGKPEYVTIAELNFLIIVEHYRNLLESNNVFKSLEIVDIEILLQKYIHNG